MKNFTLAIAALAAVTLVSNTTFAAEPFCGTSDYYNSRYNSRYDNRSANSYNHNYKSKYDNNRYDKYDYLKNSYRSTLPYNTLSLTQRLNSLYSNPWSKPLFTDYTYRANTNDNRYSSHMNWYNKYRNDRHDVDHFRHNEHWRSNR